jgi:hypothetical protein
MAPILLLFLLFGIPIKFSGISLKCLIKKYVFYKLKKKLKVKSSLSVNGQTTSTDPTDTTSTTVGKLCNLFEKILF